MNEPTPPTPLDPSEFSAEELPLAWQFLLARRKTWPVCYPWGRLWSGTETAWSGGGRSKGARHGGSAAGRCCGRAPGG